MRLRALKFFCYLLIVLGGFLTIVNIYGLNKSIRPSGLLGAVLRFKNDITLDFVQVMKSIRRAENEDEYQYAKKITKNIANGLAHLLWDEENDASRFHQLIPIW